MSGKGNKPEEGTWDRVQRFWFLEMDPFVLGLYRISIGLFMFFWFVILGPSWLEFYGSSGIALERLSGTARMRWSDPLPLRITSDGGMWVFYGICVLSSVLLTVGKLVRVSTIWLWLSVIWLTYTNRFAVNGEEQVMSILLFFSIGLPMDSSFTIEQLRDPLKRKKLFTERRRVPVWSLRALEIHMMVVYLVSFPSKPMSGAAWQEGTAVYYALMTLDYPRWLGMTFVANAGAALSRILTFSTLVVELALPIMFWWKRFRLWAVLGLISIHVGMGICLSGVVLFNGAMFCGLVLLLPSDQVREAVARFLKISDEAMTQAA